MFRAMAFVCLLAGSMAHGQNYVSFVSASGSDLNNCTAASPCATLSGAYNKTNPGGSIHALSNGEFGTITINKPIVIDGDGFKMHALSVTVDVTSSYVVLRDLTIDSILSGAAGIVGSIRSNPIFGPSTLVIEKVNVSGTGTGQLISIAMDGGSSAYLTDVSTRLGSGSSLYLNGNGLVSTAANTPCNVYMTRVIAESMPSNDGFDVIGCNAEVKDSVFRGSGQSGFWHAASFANTNLFIKNSVFSGNVTGLTLQGQNGHTPSAKLDGNTFTGNTTGLSAPAASVVSFRTNAFANNGTDGAPALTTSYR